MCEKVLILLIVGLSATVAWANIKPIHSWTFDDGTANDSVDDADGTLVGGAAIVDGAMVTTAQDQWMEMPADVIDINSYDAVTIEAWYTPTAGANTMGNTDVPGKFFFKFFDFFAENIPATFQDSRNCGVYFLFM